MKEAQECLNRANVCDRLAGRTRDESSSRILEDLAQQWRQLAHDTERHKRMTARSFQDAPRETAPILFA